MLQSIPPIFAIYIRQVTLMDVHYPKVEHKNVNDQNFVDEL